MPAINLPISPNGPLIQALIGVSTPRAEAMALAGIVVPNWVQGTFLIDTGASITCIDPGIIDPLNIPPSGAVNVQTPSTGEGAHMCNQYDVLFYIPAQRTRPA